MGLGDQKQMAHWGPEQWDRELKYARQRLDLAVGENEKRERSLDILALLDVARRHGFVQEGEGFETLHFVKIGEKE